MIKRRPSIELAQLQVLGPPVRSSDLRAGLPLVQEQSLKIPKNDKQHCFQDQKQNPRFHIMSYQMQYEELMKLAEIHANQPSSNCSSSSSSSSSISSDNKQREKQEPVNRCKFRALTLPLNLNTQKTPLIRIHHLSKPNTNIQHYQTKYQNFHQQSTQKKERDLSKRKQSANLLSIQGKKLNHSQLLNNDCRPSTSSVQQKQSRHYHIFRGSREKSHSREAKEVADKVKLQARDKQFFKLPKEKERILDIKLREKIKSDLGNRQLREKFEHKMARLKSLSVQKMNKTPKLAGLKLQKLQNVKKSPVGQKYDADLKKFKHKLHQNPKKKLII